MNYRTRKLIRPQDLNGRATVFGGRLLEWMDEEAYVFACCQLKSTSVVTRLMTGVEFVSPARLGDIVEIGAETLRFGKTSLTITAEIRNKTTKATLMKVAEMVFVRVDDELRPVPHGIS